MVVNMDLDFIVTLQNHGEFERAIDETPAKIGFRSSCDNISRIPYFLDFPFTVPDFTFEDHLAAAERFKPHITVAPDVEKGLSLDEAIYQADLLLDHSDVVIMVPKDVHPVDIPSRFRVGLTMANMGSSAPWLLWDYRNCESIHVLGGGPHRQLIALEHGLAVDSMDSTSLGIYAMYGVWDLKSKDAPDAWDYSRSLTESVNNYCSHLETICG